MLKQKIDGYTIFLGKPLGSGAFGKVYWSQEDNTLLPVAVKILDKKIIDRQEYLLKALLSQVDLLRSLSSPNIVRFKDVMESHHQYFIIQQFCNGGELRKLIKSKGKIAENEATLFLIQICNGFVELIKQGVMHRDLKPENVLIHDGVLKVADFGLSKKEQKIKKLAPNTMVGTPMYMSPQILMGEHYSSKCDIWSLGIIFYEMMVGKTPWTGRSQYELISKIRKQPLVIPEQISEVGKDFIQKCCVVRQKDRLSWDGLFDHAIFKGYFKAKNRQMNSNYKKILNQIGHQINNQFNQNSEFMLNFQHFHKVITHKHPYLSEKQIRFYYTKIDQNGSAQVTNKQFNRALKKLNKQKNKNDSKAKAEQIQDKISRAFNQIIQKLTMQKKSLYEVFDYYQLTQKGTINVTDYSKIMTLIDPTFTQSEITIAFSIIDKDNIKNVHLRDFVNYFTSVTGKLPIAPPSSIKGQNYQKIDQRFNYPLNHDNLQKYKKTSKEIQNYSNYNIDKLETYSFGSGIKSKGEQTHLPSLQDLEKKSEHMRPF